MALGPTPAMPPPHFPVKRKIGRPKGAVDLRHREATIMATKIVESPEYVESIMRRIRADSLPPAVECTLLAYAYGKPRETVDLNVTDKRDPQNLDQAPIEELHQRAVNLGNEVLAMRALNPGDATFELGEEEQR